jgi:hypothetical protein
VLNPPAVAIEVLPSPPVACIEDGQSFTFTETTCTTCVAWIWDFGDGTSLQTTGVPTAMHIYGSTGLHLASVTGRDVDGVEGRSTRAVEMVIGDKRDPPGTMGNSLQLTKVPTGGGRTGAKATWIDLAVPDATSYNLYEFVQKTQVGAFPVGPPGTLLNTPPLPLHGAAGYLWLDDITAGATPLFLQVRAANCLGQPGP